MVVRVIIKHNDSKSINYTFTKDEARLKFPKHFIETVYNFCQLVTNYLYENNQQKSLRGHIFTVSDKFVLNLKDSNKTRHLIYTFVGNDKELMEIKNGKQ